MLMGPPGAGGGCALLVLRACFTVFTAHAHKPTTLRGLARTWRPRKPGRGRWERKLGGQDGGSSKR